MIRQAQPGDVSGMLAIYAPIVIETSISFELDVPSADDFSARVARSLERHDWLVFEDEHGIVGYAYATAFRSREAYRLSAETSVYVAERARRSGVAAALYTALFDSLVAKGFHTAIAGITLPNEPSVAFHERQGFSRVGVFQEVGFKFDAWHDVMWLQRLLT